MKGSFTPGPSEPPMALLSGVDGEDKGEKKEHDITKVIWFAGGVLLSFSTVCLIGILTIQIAGVRGGAVFDIDNQLVAITEPNPGFPQLLAIAAVGAVSIAVLAFAVRDRSKHTRFAFRSGFVAATLIQVAVSAVLTAQGSTFPNLNEIQPRWVEGWVMDGGMNSAVHLILIVAGYLLLSNLSVSEKAQAPKSDAVLDTE
jgi:cytochrome bd-type quinol oxidase subunit 2